MNNLHRVVTWSRAAGTRTCDVSVASPTPYNHFETMIQDDIHTFNGDSIIPMEILLVCVQYQ